MTTIPSLKQVIASYNTPQRQLKELGLVQSHIDRFTDVAQMPNAARYSIIRLRLVAKDGTIHNLGKGTTPNQMYDPNLLTSRPCSEASQFSEIIDSTLQTSQELMLSDNNI